MKELLDRILNPKESEAAPSILKGSRSRVAWVSRGYQVNERPPSRLDEDVGRTDIISKAKVPSSAAWAPRARPVVHEHGLRSFGPVPCVFAWRIRAGSASCTVGRGDLAALAKAPPTRPWSGRSNGWRRMAFRPVGFMEAGAPRRCSAQRMRECGARCRPAGGRGPILGSDGAQVF